MHYTLIFSLISFLFLPNCLKSQTDRDVLGLITPVQLTDSNTIVMLEDYFVDVRNIERIEIMEGFKTDLSKDRKMLTIKPMGQNLPLLSNMEIILRGGKRHSFLLKTAQKKTVKLRLKDESYRSVVVKGDMNAWNQNEGKMKKIEDNWEIEFQLNAGNYEYLFVADGIELKDPLSNLTSPNGKNSILTLPKPDATKLVGLFTKNYENDLIFIGFRQKPTKIFAYWDNHLILTSAHSWKVGAADNVVGTDFTLKIPVEARFKKRSFIRIFAFNREGVSNDILIPLENGKVVNSIAQLDRSDREAQIMYFVLMDRFNNGNKKNDNRVKDARVHPMANWQGGDLSGVTQKIKEGYFKSLNINALWISPITKNPDSAFQEYPAPRRWYTGYHGYWPVSSSQIDPHFGTDAEMQNMVNTAHSNGINVLLDYVTHHVHVQHPIVSQNPAWITDLELPNGQKNLRIWEEQRLTTWFDDFLPTLDLSRDDAMKMNVDSTIFWLNKFDLDGYRHDASKHVPLTFWRALTRRIKKEVAILEKPVYQIGETYGSRELIQSYIGTGMMDAQFDFPVYFDSREVIARDEPSFSVVANTLHESFNYFGYHNTMGNITGNHDQPRFISLAGGGLSFDENDREAGFKRKIGVGDKIGYKRLQMMTALMFSIPGVPVIFYGDEIGMAGAGDPDCRRMMRFKGWSKEEKQTKLTAEKISQLRRNRLSLTYGDTEILHVSDKTFAFARDYFGELTLTVFNKNKTATEVSFDLPTRFADKILKANFGGQVKKDGTKLTVWLDSTSFDILTD